MHSVIIACTITTLITTYIYIASFKVQLSQNLHCSVSYRWGYLNTYPIPYCAYSLLYLFLTLPYSLLYPIAYFTLLNALPYSLLYLFNTLPYSLLYPIPYFTLFPTLPYSLLYPILLYVDVLTLPYHTLPYIAFVCHALLT